MKTDVFLLATEVSIRDCYFFFPGANYKRFGLSTGNREKE